MTRHLKESGMSNREITKEFGISRNTVSKMLRKTKIQDKMNRKRRSKLDPYREQIKIFIDEYNLSAVRILEEIRKLGYNGGYTILKDYCAFLRKDRRIQAVYRYETDPGKQSQVDFGEFGYIDIDGKRRKLYAFSIILGYSRMRYAEFTTDISTENVIKMHLNAFTFFGGFTHTILYDNMKQVVIDRKIKASESTFNWKFMDFAEYYGIVIRLCYPYSPQTKGKIESTIKYLRNNFFNGRTFENINDMNNRCIEWLKKVNSQPHGTTHEIPMERAKEESLNPLSIIPSYMTRNEQIRKISRDCYISYKGNRYSVPWKYSGRECRIIEESSILKIEIDSSIVAEHGILTGTGRTSRKKEHFEGLLKAIREENSAIYEQKVEERNLKTYDGVI